MKQRYGYRRIHTELRKQGWQVGHKLVYKLMDQMRLKSKVRPRRKYNSHKGQTSRIADNLLDRNFTPDKPNTVWVSDITEFRVAGTKVYLSPIMDLYDRTILAHTLSMSRSRGVLSGRGRLHLLVRQRPTPTTIQGPDHLELNQSN